MFGNLLGTLQKFKQDETQVKVREQKKKEVEKKIEEKPKRKKKRQSERNTISSQRKGNNSRKLKR